MVPGEEIWQTEAKTKRKLDIVCDKVWLPFYVPSHSIQGKMGERNGTNKGPPSLPGGNEYTSLQRNCKVWMEPSGDPNPIYAEAYRAKVYRPQTFPLIIALALFSP